MRCQRTRSPTNDAGHGQHGVLLAALATVLTATAVGQNAPNAPATSQTEKPAATPKNQTKPPAAAPGTEAKQPVAPASPAPKPSMIDNAKSKMQSIFGMKKNQAVAEKPGQPGQPNQPGQPRSLFDRFLHPGKSENPAPGPHPATPNPAASANPAASGSGKENKENPVRITPNPPAEPPRHELPGNGGGPRPAPGVLIGPAGAPRAGAPDVPRARVPVPETPTPHGNLMQIGPGGTVRQLRSPQNNMAIRYGMNGSRQIRVDHPDGSRIVLASRGLPYVQKPWNFGSRTYDHRTYVDNGQLTHQFYRPYHFGGATLDAYAPQRYYSQDYYKWVGTQQLWTPPAWSYTTKQEPWYTHYQGYFTPQPSYASPVYWLTDFVLATSLFEAYNAHPLPAQAPPPIPAPLTSQSSAPQPLVTSPLIQAPIAPAPSAPAPIARTPSGPITVAPAPTPPPTSTPTPAAPLPQPPIVPAQADEQGASLTIWDRITNYIRGLFGQTSPEPATPSPEPPVASNAAPITDDVKNKVAAEVQAQLAQEAREADVTARNVEPKAGAGGVVEELATHAQHVFVVASDLDLVDDANRRCMITEGDVVQIQSARVDIEVSDLQEMQNHMRATIDQGLANTPRAATEPTVTPAFAQAAPPPDPDAKSEIEKQKTIAASVERG